MQFNANRKPRAAEQKVAAKRKRAENTEASKNASQKWRDENPDYIYANRKPRTAEQKERRQKGRAYKPGPNNNAKRSKMSQATAVASGNAWVAKIINTANIIHNGGRKLEPEFKAYTYVGDVLAEEEFEATQPGQPRVRRDCAGEMRKICSSKHWVSPVIGRSHALNSLFADWHRFLAAEDTARKGLRVVAALLRR